MSKVTTIDLNNQGQIYWELGNKLLDGLTIEKVVKEKISVDSFKIRIPIEAVTWMSDDLTAQWKWVNTLTGEMKDDEFKSKSYFHNKDGIGTKFAPERQMTAAGVNMEFLTILVTSKVLKQQYLQGITRHSLQSVYGYLQGLNICDFSFEAFLSGELTDVDFKQDFINIVGLKLVDKLSANAKPVKFGRAATPFRQPNNQGLQFSERKTKRFKTQPYLKIYNKSIHMEAKCSEFKKLFLPDVDLLNLWRIETTVKNKSHFRQLGIHNTTLKAIMDLDQDQLDKILNKAIQSHTEPFTRVYSSDGIKPDDVVYRNMIQFMMEGKRGLSYESILKIALGDLEGSNRTKKRDKFDRIYNTYIKGSDQDKKSLEMDAVLRVIGCDV